MSFSVHILCALLILRFLKIWSVWRIYCTYTVFVYFQSNYIKTSKYSILTFLPLNLFEQFQRLANFYFLCLLVLQLIPAISSLTPVTTALPLIGVLGLTAIKDAYDDIVSIWKTLKNQYKWDISCNLKLGGLELVQKDTVNYLRVIPYSKLSWMDHLEHTVWKYRKCIWQLRRAIGRNWGLIS